MPIVVDVRFMGGPLDGLIQGWSVEDELPERIRISPELAYSRGGMKMEVTTPGACGVLEEGELAIDTVSYLQREPGRYWFEPKRFDGEPAEPNLAPA